MAINFRSNTIIKNLRVGPLSGGGNGGGGGGSISTTNLQLYWDIGNSTSYSGTGTAITDLSGNGNDGILTGTPTYSSAGASSYLDWTGDNTAFATYTGNLLDDTLNIESQDQITVSNWVTLTPGISGMQTAYISSAMNGFVRFSQGPIGDNTQDQLLTYIRLYDNNSEIYYHPAAMALGSSASRWTDLSTYGLSTSDYGNWFNFTITVGLGTYNFYLNGIEQWSNTYNDTLLSLEKYKFSFGSELDASVETGLTRVTWTGYNGKWGNSAVYNRVLPASEVLSNFNALKSRYGY